MHGFSVQETIWSGILVFMLFVCVILHEYGHALTAARYGIPTRDIFILPIGGLARLEYLPHSPTKEIVIAIAGPLVNLVIASLLALYLYFSGEVWNWGSLQSVQGIMSLHGLIFGLFLVNATLFVFNLVPAFPMDGGRILRATLSYKLGRKRATIFASYIAQFMAMGFFLYGANNEMMTLALIGVFIFFTARWERRGLYQEEEE